MRFPKAEPWSTSQPTKSNPRHTPRIVSPQNQRTQKKQQSKQNHINPTNDDDKLRQQAKNFYQSAMGQNVSLEKINCMGGRSENIFFQCASCPWMKCCKERGVSACTECSEYPCKPIAEHEEKYVNTCNKIHGCEK